MIYGQQQRKMLDSFLLAPGEYDRMLEKLGEFFTKEFEPAAREMDEMGISPRPNFEKLSKEGIPAISPPPEYNGLGLPFVLYMAIVEMLAKACANTALCLSVHSMVCEGINLFGTEAQKEEFLKNKGLAKGKALAAFALTEPCCGSDAAAIRSTATRSGGKYILNGTKNLVTNAPEADFIMVLANTAKGPSIFLSPRQAAGLKVLKDIAKMGFRGNRLAPVRLENCKIPEANLIGEEGKGLDYAKQILNCGRMTVAAIAVGIARGAYEKSLSYALKRKAFGKNISEFQLIQQKLADMETEINAARLLLYYSAHLRDKGLDYAAEVTQAKLFASEMALRVCDNAVQIHGGYGYLDACDVHRHWRDARLLTIAEGTSEILRLLLAHLVIKRQREWTRSEK